MRHLAATLLGLLSFEEIAAQTFEGRVLDIDSGAPVAGAMVVGENLDGQVGDRVLTHPDGTFVLRSADSFELSHLRVERIGYGSTTHPLEELRSTEPSVLRLAFSPVVLEGVGVVGENICGAEFSSSEEVYAIWLEIRKALEITRLSQTERVLQFVTERVRRTLDPDDLEERERSAEQQHSVGERPYRSLTGPEMTGNGWVQVDEDDGSIVFYAPDAAALLSDEFSEQHCFRAGVTKEEVVLQFTPHPSRESIPEIEGEIILDGDTHELSALRFHYTSIPLPEVAQGYADGEVRFTVAPNGLRIVRDWRIRMPVVSLRRRYRVDGIIEEGGRVLSIDAGTEVIELSPMN